MTNQRSDRDLGILWLSLNADDQLEASLKVYADTFMVFFFAASYMNDESMH